MRSLFAHLPSKPALLKAGTSHPHTTLCAKRMGWNHHHDSHGAGHSGTQECLGQPLGFTLVLRGLRSKSQGQLVASLAESQHPSRRPLAACLWKGVGQHLSESSHTPFDQHTHFQGPVIWKYLYVYKAMYGCSLQYLLN